MTLDPITQLGAVTRTVTRREQDGRLAHVVIASRRYPTHIADVWEAITSAERLPRWFLPVSGELRLGGRYQLQGNAGGTITRCEPPRELGLTWEFGGQTTWVAVKLNQLAADDTELVLEHSAHVEDAHWDRFGPGAVGVGWDLTLFGLANHLDGAPDINPQWVAAWSASEAGKAAMRRSSAAWCEAHIASGEDAEKARASAAATVAAYTGDAATPEGSG